MNKRAKIKAFPGHNATTRGSFAAAFNSLAGPKNPGNFIVNNITSQSGQPIAVRDSFLHALDNWEFSLPLNQLWMVFFNIPPYVNNKAMAAFGETFIGAQGPDEGTDLARQLLYTDRYMRNIGCSFAQTVSIPQEQNAIGRVGPSNRGFLKMPVLEQRQQFASINIEFLENNLSFVDFLIRPWIVLSSHAGYVARQKVNLTTDLMVINFAKGGVDFEFDDPRQPHRENGSRTDTVHIRNDRGFVARKMYMFQGCTPINTSPERYGYSPESGVDRRDTEWVFKRYQVMTPSSLKNTMFDYQEKEEKSTREFWKQHKQNTQSEHIFSRGSAPGNGFNLLDILGL